MTKSSAIKKLEEDYWQVKFEANKSKYMLMVKNNNYNSERLRREFMTKFSEGSANDLTKAIIALFWVCGGRAWRINVGGIYDKKTGKYRKSGASEGVSDIVGCLNGVMYGVEVKFGNDRQSDNQKKFERELTYSKGVYIIARTLEDVDNVLRPIAQAAKAFDLTSPGNIIVDAFKNRGK